MAPSMIRLLVFRTYMTTWLCTRIGHIIILNVFYDYSHEGHVFYDYDIYNYSDENMVNMLFSYLTSLI